MAGRALIILSAFGLIAFLTGPARAATPDDATLKCVADVLSELPETLSIKATGAIWTLFDKPAPWVRKFLVMDYAMRDPDGERTDELYLSSGNNEEYELLGLRPAPGKLWLWVYTVRPILYKRCRVLVNTGAMPESDNALPPR